VLTDGTINLASFELEDAPLLMVLDRDPDCARWFDFPEIRMDEAAHRDHAEREIRRWWNETAEGSTFHLAIHVGDVAIGMVALRRLDTTSAAMSYALVAASRGRGYATRATRLLARHGLEQLGFTRIELRTDVENVASQRVAERAGFSYVRLDPRAHTFEHHPPFVHQARDELVYELTR
jgi:RimJ/RimL family protein N-acetyltransferase